MSIFTATFWRAAAERGAKATAWALSSTLIANGTGLIDTDWRGVLSVAGMAGLLSVLGSIASDAATSGTGPSLTNAERLDPPPPGPDDNGASDLVVLAAVGLLALVILIAAGVIR